MQLLKIIIEKYFSILTIMFVITLMIIITFSFGIAKKFVYKRICLYNTNVDKVLRVNEINDIYNNIANDFTIPKFYSTFKEAVDNASKKVTSFKGKLTHYGPDCLGCGGHLACNGQNVKKGNIYYNDKTYGRIRIVAADRNIPCGSIIRINLDKYNYMYTIVLDRGGMISEARIDLLKISGKAWSPVRTKYNVVFDIVRLGYSDK